MSHPADHELEDVRRDDAARVVNDKAPTPAPDRRVIRRFADLRDWLDRKRILAALEDGDAPEPNTRR
jgi:hypothetical protein